MNKTFIKNYLMKIANSHCGAVEREDITNCTDAYIKTLKDWDTLNELEQIHARANIITMCYGIILDNNIHVWNFSDKVMSDIYKIDLKHYTKIKCGKVIL